MTLEHAILVSLRERPAAGLELARRFDRSIGFFWSATHQQIYRVLGRMERDGWVRSAAVEQQGRPDKRVYEVTDSGEDELQRWLVEPMPTEKFRSELAVRLRGASYGDRTAVLQTVREQLAEHTTRLAHYEQLAARDFPDPDVLTGQRLDHYLVLRGGIGLEQFWVDWLTEYLEAHGAESHRPEPSGPTMPVPTPPAPKTAAPTTTAANPSHPPDAKEPDA